MYAGTFGKTISILAQKMYQLFNISPLNLTVELRHSQDAI